MPTVILSGVKRLPATLLLAGLCASCSEGSTSETSGPAAASVIPHAAPDAQGADYPPAGAASAVVSTTGVPECDAYFQKIRTCTALPKSAMTSFAEAEKAMREAITRSATPEARRAIGQACEQAQSSLTMCDRPGGSKKPLGF